MNTYYKEPGVIVRYEGNPIISPKDIPYPCDLVYNPAACKLGDKYALILRIENNIEKDTSKFRQCLMLALSDDGYNFEIEKDPILFPLPDEYGKCNDPRVTYIDGWYYLCYCSDPDPYYYNDQTGGAEKYEGIYLCIAKSKDLHNWERIYKSEPDNRNAVIFPEKINGLYARLDRPFRRGYREQAGHDIWISYSPDMEFWGKHDMILSYKEVEWAKEKIGAAAPPIKTDKGWLVLFHGAEFLDPFPDPNGHYEEWRWMGKPEGFGMVYRCGVMLLDLNDPTKILGRYKNPIMEINASYEKDTYYRPNVVFPCGIIPEDNGEIKIYYGASDTHIAVATAKIDELVRLCLEG